MALVCGRDQVMERDRNEWVSFSSFLSQAEICYVNVPEVNHHV